MANTGLINIPPSRPVAGGVLPVAGICPRYGRPGLNSPISVYESLWSRRENPGMIRLISFCGVMEKSADEFFIRMAESPVKEH